MLENRIRAQLKIEIKMKLLKNLSKNTGFNACSYSQPCVWFPVFVKGLMTKWTVWFSTLCISLTLFTFNSKKIVMNHDSWFVVSSKLEWLQCRENFHLLRKKRLIHLFIFAHVGPTLQMTRKIFRNKQD